MAGTFKFELVTPERMLIPERVEDGKRDTVPAESGWRAIASMAAATARPSASAGPMAPNETASAAAAMLTISMRFMRCLPCRDEPGNGVAQAVCEWIR